MPLISLPVWAIHDTQFVQPQSGTGYTLCNATNVYGVKYV